VRRRYARIIAENLRANPDAEHSQLELTEMLYDFREKGQGALKLMQRIRDEAHRYANLYNELLLSKRMKESLLDDCPGMTQARKAILLKKYGSIANMKKATLDELQNSLGCVVARLFILWD